MKLKSLLLGSAAALIAFSGARAADAVIAEPEPVEYVKVCDAYGAGYFYLPGTETCLKIGGFVRYEINYTSAAATGTTNGVANKKTWDKTTMASVQLSAKSDTDLGTLEGFMDLRANARNTGTSGAFSNNGATIDSAYISLGGLKMGYFASAFDGGIVGETDSLGGTTSNTIQYTFASDGFDATIGLNEDTGPNLAPNLGTNPSPITEGNYTPNVSANAGFSAGSVAVRAFINYDDKEVSTQKDAFAFKLRVGADVTEGGKLEAAVIYANNSSEAWSQSEWSVAAAYRQKLTDTVTGVVMAQYWSNTDFAVAGTPTKWAVGTTVDWTPVKNFLVRGQLLYSDPSGNSTTAANANVTTARIRFQRSF